MHLVPISLFLLHDCHRSSSGRLRLKAWPCLMVHTCLCVHVLVVTIVVMPLCCVNILSTTSNSLWWMLLACTHPQALLVLLLASVMFIGWNCIVISVPEYSVAHFHVCMSDCRFVLMQEQLQIACSTVLVAVSVLW